jgi:hypothetical protein
MSNNRSCIRLFGIFGVYISTYLIVKRFVTNKNKDLILYNVGYMVGIYVLMIDDFTKKDCIFWNTLIDISLFPASIIGGNILYERFMNGRSIDEIID